MNKSQVQRIIDALEDGAWHCTSQFYADFMADPRRRMMDIKNRGYTLESRVCRSHAYHNGQSKEWRMTKIPIKLTKTFSVNLPEGRKVIEVAA